MCVVCLWLLTYNVCALPCVQREKAERIKQLAAQVREENLKKAAAAKPAAKPAAKEPTARERALSFAKNVPKPEPKPEAAAAGPANKAASSQGGPASKPGGYAAQAGGAKSSVLEELEAQHSRDQQKVDAIRAELARLGVS